MSRSHLRGASIGDDECEDIAWAFHPDRSAWAAIGETSGSSIRVLTTAGITSSIFVVWQQDGWTAETAAPWVHAGFVLLDDANAWASNHLGHFEDPVIAAQWRTVKARSNVANSSEMAKKWVDAGFTPSEAVEWSDQYFGPGRAARWRAAGVTPYRAYWLDHASGVDPEDVRDGEIVSGPYFTPRELERQEHARRWRAEQDRKAAGKTATAG